MNDRYLFRGKRVDNGEWIIGSLLQGTNPCIYVTPDDLTKTIVSAFKGVDPTTIGQCSGLRDDKDGRLMFEGDIVKTHSGLIGRVVMGEYNDGEGWIGHAYGWYWDGHDDSGEPHRLGFSSDWSGHEVIGNIHDSPELLEGGG